MEENKKNHGTIPEFLETKKIAYSLPTVRKLIKEKFLKGELGDCIATIESKTRTTFRITDFDALFRILF